jgi:hypothetical protein
MKVVVFLVSILALFSCRENLSNNKLGIIFKEDSAVRFIDSNTIAINKEKIEFTYTNKHYLALSMNFRSSEAIVKLVNLILKEYSKEYTILNWEIARKGEQGDVIGIWIYVSPKDTFSLKSIEDENLQKDFIEIQPGNSLCGTLGMTTEEALSFANKFNYPLRYNSWGQLNVILQPGEKFKKTWQPDTLKYLVKKN